MKLRSFLRVSSLVAAFTAFVSFANIAQADGTPERVVGVGGSVTEIVYALGEENRLVARDTTSTYPTAASELPDVGYIRRLSPEGVMSVSPDLILMLDGSGPPEAVEVLAKSGIQIVDVPESYSPKGILEKVRIVGDALGVPDKAAALSERLQAALSRAETDRQSSSVKVLFVLSNQGGRILASGEGTAAASIIKLAGAQNATPEFTGYKQLTTEAILQAAPDVVLMMSHNANHGAGDIFDNAALASTPAGQNRQLIKMPGSYLLGFGPRTADAIVELSSKLAKVKGE
ncbi:heme/hemin ABC transporter substrate-binding protein [Roseibium sp.]|uniref:heme/hemin ABC transporter substrate-binding protein n=1 Tax=Roseibium sp. TaxID=1936156 RepID=UPI003A977E74